MDKKEVAFDPINIIIGIILILEGLSIAVGNIN